MIKLEKKLKTNLSTKKFDFIDKNGNAIAISVANLLRPVELLESIDAPGTLKIKFRTDENNKHRDFVLYATDMSEPSKFHSKLLANSYFIGYNLVNHLRYYLNQELQVLQSTNQIRFSHKSLGFYEESNGNKVFLYEKSKVTRGISHYYDTSFSFTKGTNKNYLKFLDEEILPYKEMQLALVLGLTSVTASFLNEYVDINTIAINMCGESSTGKSTSAQFIASLWASPKISNSALVKTFNSTNYARMHQIEGMNGVPIIFDDATTAPGVNRSSLVYEITQGESRARMTNFGQDIAQGLPWSGLCLVTSETPLLSDADTRQGLIARVIDTNNIVWTKDAEHAERIKRFIMNCYGHIAPSFFNKFALMNPNDIYELYENSLQEVKDGILKQDNLTKRIINKLAVIYLTAKLTEMILGFKLDQKAILELLISFDQDDIDDRHIGVKGIEQIKYYIQRYQHKFRVKANELIESAEKGELLGIMEFQANNVQVTIPSKVAKQILADAKIYEYKACLKYWDIHNLIRPQSGVRTRRISEFSTTVVTFIFDKPEINSMIVWPVVMNIIENPYSPNDDIAVTISDEDDKEAINAIFEEQSEDDNDDN